MPEPRRLLVFVAHPDDESFGCGSTIAEAVAQGWRVSVCCASLGEAGEVAPGYDLSGASLAEVRERELRTAAELLGARVVPPLGLRDSGWDGEPAADAICGVTDGDLVARLAAVVGAERPDAVLTLAGDDGHRDHIRLAHAVPRAAPDLPCYLWCLPNDLMQRWAAEMTRLRPDTAHLAVEISKLGTPAARITKTLDTSSHLDLRRRAMAAHASQTSPYDGLSADLADAFLTADHLIRLA